KKLMLFLLIFVFFLSAFFANDGAILIITPIIIALFSTLKDCKNHAFILSSFLLSLSFLCDASSNALVISNLTNIITANYFKIEFLEFAKNMFLPNFFVLLSTIVTVFVLYVRVLPKRLEFKLIKKEQISLKLFFLCIVFLFLFVISFFIGEIFNIKISFFALLWAGIFWLIILKIQGKKSIKILFEAPYGVLLFSFGLYMVVFALHKIGVSEILVKSYAFLMQDKSGIFGVALISAFGSSVFNNLPMVLIGDLALKEYFENFSFDSLMIYAHLLGVNIGPKLTPIGSLATLLWLGVLARKGINISFWQYCKFGFLITLPVLVFSLFALIV
ncbi:arsenic transporter, partial [Campylobacter jejuni]|nr:arsenic transporter [Campylobacter jejuni]